MTDEQSAETSQPDVWMGTVELPWPDDAAGPWLVTAHWARIDGRAMIVGLDVRSFHWANKEPLRGGQFAEVTQRVLRGVSISQVRDATRAQLLQASMLSTLAARSAPLNSDHEPDAGVVADADNWHAERVSSLTAKGEPRKRRPAATEDLLRHVAALYEQAVSQGDKAPSKYVEDQLRELGEPRLSTDGGRVLVRQWVRRSRERGYLSPSRQEGN